MSKKIKIILSKIKLLKLAQMVHPYLNPKLRRQKYLKRQNDMEFKEFMDYLCDKPGLNAIQVGSNDGVSNDPLRKYIVNKHWNAILIEPVLRYFDSLKVLYAECENVKVLNLAVSPAGGGGGGLLNFMVSMSLQKKSLVHCAQIGMVS